MFLQSTKYQVPIYFQYHQYPSLTQGGLAAPDDSAVQRIAAHCLKLWSGKKTTGHTHAQSRRFLDPDWCGGGMDEDDPPLRSLVMALAEGEKTMSDFIHGKSREEQSFLQWVSSFRLVSWSFASGKVSNRKNGDSNTSHHTFI